MTEVQDVVRSIKNIYLFIEINNGLIVNAKGVRRSNFSAYSLCSPKARKLNMPFVNSLQVTLKFSTKQRDTFLSENHIDHSAVDLEHCYWIFANSANNTLNNESLVKNVCMKIQCSQLKLMVEKEMIKPSNEMVAKVKEALRHDNPYNELMTVFEIYGKFLPKKIILEHKIYRTTCLIVNECHSDLNFKEEQDENEIWVKTCLESDSDSLKIIGWNELYPIYEIFEPLCREIKSILEIIDQPGSFNIKGKHDIETNKPIEHVEGEDDKKIIKPVDFDNDEKIENDHEVETNEPVEHVESDYDKKIIKPDDVDNDEKIENYVERNDNEKKKQSNILLLKISNLQYQVLCQTIKHSVVEIYEPIEHDEIVSEIEKEKKKFDYKDFQAIKELSNISDELNNIKSTYFKTIKNATFLKEYYKDEYDKFIREVENLRNIEVNENVIKFIGIAEDIADGLRHVHAEKTKVIPYSVEYIVLPD
ncbi:hypothetical protein C2G38_2158841 [Gigaspora rosea]|uniref:Uncharacterized protein n=1 Tax=Gigaspora rosea TaxID=44941 RepID=A0A397W016_9GLOM|nr:hypothetical protein C2G38_2158841 [Gigaspora rosea]